MLSGMEKTCHLCKSSILFHVMMPGESSLDSAHTSFYTAGEMRGEKKHSSDWRGMLITLKPDTSSDILALTGSGYDDNKIHCKQMERLMLCTFPLQLSSLNIK